MKAVTYQITVDEPCHEDWDRMSSCSDGRFCGQCNKQVIDFTSLPDADIVRVLEKNKGEVCGRFLTNQLDRNINLSNQHSHRFVYKAVAATLLFSGLSIMGHAQGAVRKRHSTDTTKNTAVVKNSSAYNKEIRGKVIEGFTLYAVPFASVRVEELNMTVVADKEGWFTLNLPINTNIDSYTFVVFAEDHETERRKMETKLLTEAKEIKIMMKTFITSWGKWRCIRNPKNVRPRLPVKHLFHKRRFIPVPPSLSTLNLLSVGVLFCKPRGRKYSAPTPERPFPSHPTTNWLSCPRCIGRLWSYLLLLIFCAGLRLCK